MLNPIPINTAAIKRYLHLFFSRDLNKKRVLKSNTKINCMSIVLLRQTATTIGVIAKIKEETKAAFLFLKPL